MSDFDNKFNLDPDEVTKGVILDDEIEVAQEPLQEAVQEEVVLDSDSVEEVVDEMPANLEESAPVQDEVVEDVEMNEVVDEVNPESIPENAEAVEPTLEGEESTDDNVDEVEAAVAFDIDIEQYKTILDAHFQNLRALIKYTKAKDESIHKLSNELQKYREDYCAKTFKSIASLLISYREDCRRSLTDMDTFELSLDRVKKYLSFLSDDYEEMLSNMGCEEEGCTWTFNGKPLNSYHGKEVVFPQLFEGELEMSDEYEPLCSDNISEYLVSVENSIKALLADNETVDKCLRDYITLSTFIDSDIVNLCVYPSIRKTIGLFLKLKHRVEDILFDIDEENMNDNYRDALNLVINGIEDILLSGGVSIYTTVDDLFDTKKNRLVKAVVTDDPALDRKIAKQYTECYLMNDIVLYPAKVDVYKYQA